MASGDDGYLAAMLGSDPPTCSTCNSAGEDGWSWILPTCVNPRLSSGGNYRHYQNTQSYGVCMIMQLQSKEGLGYLDSPGLDSISI